MDEVDTTKIQSDIDKPLPDRSSDRKDEVIIKSRGDLSNVRTEDEREATMKASGIFGGKGFFGTPLPLIPDIRSCEVKEGELGRLLEAFGVKRKFNRTVTLHKGPNSKANRYLIFQYKRMFKAIEATLVPGSVTTPAGVIWKYNFYKISKNMPGQVVQPKPA